MNERIKELAKKAGFQSYITTHEEDVAMFEKFAELIVRECIDTIMDASDPRYRAGEYFANKIKQHFGVK